MSVLCLQGSPSLPCYLCRPYCQWALFTTKRKYWYASVPVESNMLIWLESVLGLLAYANVAWPAEEAEKCFWKEYWSWANRRSSTWNIHDAGICRKHIHTIPGLGKDSLLQVYCSFSSVTSKRELFIKCCCKTTSVCPKLQRCSHYRLFKPPVCMWLKLIKIALNRFTITLNLVEHSCFSTNHYPKAS